VCSDKCRLKISSPAGGYKDHAVFDAFVAREVKIWEETRDA